jgi:hypothetical protein
MSYQIKQYSYDQAKKLNVNIKPSKNKHKKIDVFKNNKKIASIGDVNYDDYPTFIIKHSLNYANERKRLYNIRHKQNNGINSFYAKNILW